MRNFSILTVIFFTSLVIMACGFGGFARQRTETRPTVVQEIAKSSTPTQSALSQGEKTAVEAQPTQRPKNTSQEKTPPTPTIDPLASAKSCLAKTWQISGLSDYVLAAVPPELVKEYGLEYVSTSGAAYLRLTPDDKIVLQAENLVFIFSAQFSIFEVPVEVSIDGTATGTYTIDSTTLTIKDMDTRGLTASAKAMNEELIDSQQIINAIPFTRPPYNKATYTCQGDTLELSLSGYPEDMPPLVFQAIK